MPDLGWSELLVIGVVALIIVGPKDLPLLFRAVGRFMGKARGMAREFSNAMNDAAKQSGIDEVSKGLKTATNPIGSVMDSVRDTARDLGAGIDPSKYNPNSETGKLAERRSEETRKIQASTARAAAERKAREAREAAEFAERAEAELNTPPDECGSRPGESGSAQADGKT